MSKPESTGESLESILASIRRSLSEQSTDVLETDLPEEEAAAPAEEPNAAPLELPRGDGLTRRLADGARESQQVEAPPPVVPLPADPQPAAQAAEPPPSAAAPVAAPAAAPAQSDALWFLGGRGQARAGDGPAAPKAAKTGVVRGPLPPFFGSSAEAQKTEVMLVQPPPSSPASPGVLVPPPPKVHEHGNGLDTAAPMPRAAAPVVGVPDPLRNGLANSLFGPAPADSKAPPSADTPHVHALEAMVTELLRPMLQQWLDENMPRLISAALKDEASRMAARDPKKS